MRRNPSEVQLILVTKNVSVERIKEAYDAGARDFGENRAQELLNKIPQLPSDICWHFIGHLQSNKAKSVAGKVSWLHSLDRWELAREIQKQAQKKNVTMDTLLQVNTSGETTQSGVRPDEVRELFQKMISLDRLHPQGFMTIGPLTEDENKIRASFKKLKDLRDELQTEFPQANLSHLSMGMSSDFEIALEEGATMIRVGTAVFGERNPNEA